MSYRRLLSYNVIGGIAWITSLVYAGDLFGSIRWVKNNLTWIVIGILVVSLNQRSPLTCRSAGHLLPTRALASTTR
jgi:hypothetical protein